MRKKSKKFPTRGQWRQFFRISNSKEKIGFVLLVLMAIISGTALGVNYYFKNTELLPANGGVFREGIVGEPRFINPLYLSTEDSDRDIVEILFSGLMKYDEKGGLIADLAESYKIEDEGKTYEFTIKENIFWHDNEPMTADDIVFTVNLAQEPKTQSPLRIKWMGVTVEKVNDMSVRFRLPKKYSGFLETLTLKILPKHIFENIAPQNLAWRLMTEKFLIGSGPFKFEKLIQDSAGKIKKIVFKKNTNYYAEQPFIDEFSFIFFANIEDVLKSAKLGDVDGFALTDPKYFRNVENNFNDYVLSIPRYFALFFNLNSENIFEEKELKQVLNLAINKEQILQDVFFSKGQSINSPILPDFFEFEPAPESYAFNKESAEEMLESLGFKINTETGIREKTAEKQAPFTFTKSLTVKSQGQEVTELQKCLAKDPEVYPDGTISGYFGSKTKAAVIKFQEKYAEDILTPIGLTKGTGDVKPMTRAKLNEVCFEKPTELLPLNITITTCDKFPLVEIAKILKENWEAVGAGVEIKKASLGDLQTDILANRNFEILLFGEALASIPDPFPFWHSSQKEYPGLNISGYSSKQADLLLERAREADDSEKIKETFEEFQAMLLEDMPAIFLARPHYVYILSSKAKGFEMEKVVEPAKRFSSVESWFIKTKRIWK